MMQGFDCGAQLTAVDVEGEGGLVEDLTELDKVEDKGLALSVSYD